MSTVQYYVATSADGFITDRDGGLEWLLAFGMAEFQARYDTFIADVGALVMGSGTYQFMLGQDEPWPYGELPTWVFSSRLLPRIEGADVRLVQGSPAEHRSRIVDSARGRNVWMVGGGVLAAQFADAGVLDQLLVTVMPVVLGGGRPVLPVDRPLDLRLTGTYPYPSDAVECAYSVVRPGAGDQAGSATSSTMRVGSV